MATEPGAKEVLAKSERVGYGCDFSAADEDVIRRALRVLAAAEEWKEGIRASIEPHMLADILRSAPFPMPTTAALVEAIATALNQDSGT